MRRSLKAAFLCVLTVGCAVDQPKPHVRLPMVVLQNVTLEGVAATVQWFALDAEFLGPDGALVGPSPITRFALEREDVAAGKRTLLSDAIPPTTGSYVDRGLEAGKKYRYRLTFHVEDGTGSSVETEPFDGPKVWSLKFQNPMKAPDGKGLVFIRIRKFEKGVGFVEAGHVHCEGERIGWWIESIDAAVPRHRVTPPGGMSLEVDFDTGATLTAVVPVKKIVEVKRCKSIYERGTGRKLGCDQVVEQRNFEYYEISYRDSEGEHRVNVPEASLLHLLCPEHLANPAAKPEDPRLLKARILLDEADRLWDSDSAASIKLYQRLLQEYKDVVIRLQVRNKVEGRARQTDD